MSDLWAQLQAEEKAQQVSQRQKMSASSSVASFNTVFAKPATAKSHVIETAEMVVGMMDLSLLKKRDKIVSADSSTGETQADTLRKKVNLLDAENFNERRKALEHFLSMFSDPTLTLDEIEVTFTHCSKSLIQRFADTNERNRDTAIRVFLQFMERGANVIPVLAHTIAVVMQRLGGGEEMSEEVRLLLLLLLSRSVALCGRTLGPHVPGLISVLQVTTQDVHPEVRKETCQCIILLCSAMPQIMKPYCSPLIQSLFSSLAHRLSPVKIAAISTLEALLLCGGSSEIQNLVAWQEPNVIPIKDFFPDAERQPKINYFGLLCVDPNLSVRKTFVGMIIRCIRELSDRWDHYGRLFPYLLNGIADANEAFAHECFLDLEKIGKVYEIEKTDELRDTLSYGIHAPTESNNAERWRTRRHKKQFDGRPCLGARLMVRDQFVKLIGSVTTELGEWKESVRVHTLHLLYILILYTEGYITGHIPAIVSAVNRVISETFKISNMHVHERKMCLEALECCELIGEFVPPAAFFGSLFPPLLSPPINLNFDQCVIWRSSHLAILAAFLRGCSPARQLESKNEIRRILIEISAAASDNETLTQIIQCLYEMRDVLTEEEDLNFIFFILATAFAAAAKNGQYYDRTVAISVSAPLLPSHDPDVSPWSVTLQGAASLLQSLPSHPLPPPNLSEPADHTLENICKIYARLCLFASGPTPPEHALHFSAEFLSAALSSGEANAHVTTVTLQGLRRLLLLPPPSPPSLSSLSAASLAKTLSIAKAVGVSARSWSGPLAIALETLTQLTEMIEKNSTDIFPSPLVAAVIKVGRELLPSHPTELRQACAKFASFLLSGTHISSISLSDVCAISEISIRRISDADAPTRLLSIQTAIAAAEKIPSAGEADENSMKILISNRQTAQDSQK